MKLSRAEFLGLFGRSTLGALAAAGAASVAVAQSANDYETDEVNRIASKLLCDCGCNLAMDCIMPPSGVCGVCRDNKIRIAAMLNDGLTEQQILDLYADEYGEQILAERPGIAGFLAPYIALALGGLGVGWAIQHYKKVKPAPAVAPGNEAELARFQKQIDRDMEELD